MRTIVNPWSSLREGMRYRSIAVIKMDKKRMTFSSYPAMIPHFHFRSSSKKNNKLSSPSVSPPNHPNYITTYQNRRSNKTRRKERIFSTSSKNLNHLLPANWRRLAQKTTFWIFLTLFSRLNPHSLNLFLKDSPKSTIISYGLRQKLCRDKKLLRLKSGNG